MKELTPIATVIPSVNCVAVNAADPLHSFADLVAFAKGNPGKLTYGTAGKQSHYYLFGLTARRGHAPCSLQGQRAGRFRAARSADRCRADRAWIGRSLAKIGAIRILTVMEPERFAAAPSVPAMKEVLPGFSAPLSWSGFFGPPDLLQPIVDKLGGEIGNDAYSPES